MTTEEATQMCAAPPSAFSASQWCLAANVLSQAFHEEGRLHVENLRSMDSRILQAENHLLSLRSRADKEPLDVDVSDYGDEWVAGFLKGQSHALDCAMARDT